MGQGKCLLYWDLEINVIIDLCVLCIYVKYPALFHDNFAFFSSAK